MHSQHSLARPDVQGPPSPERLAARDYSQHEWTISNIASVVKTSKIPLVGD